MGTPASTCIFHDLKVALFHTSQVTLELPFVSLVNASFGAESERIFFLKKNMLLPCRVFFIEFKFIGNADSVLND